MKVCTVPAPVAGAADLAYRPVLALDGEHLFVADLGDWRIRIPNRALRNAGILAGTSCDFDAPKTTSWANAAGSTPPTPTTM